MIGVQCCRERREDPAPAPQRTSDAAIRFDDLCTLLQSLGFDKRVKGSHHLFRKAGVEERINLQREGNNAKPYQAKQVRAVILKHKLGEVE